MAVIITFSGLVGSGKSVCAKYVASELSRRGLPVYYIRFRQLSVKSFFTKKEQIRHFRFKKNITPPGENGKPRFENFRLRSSSSFLLAMGYFLWKAYLFRLLVAIRYTRDIVIADRYIYDHLAHFRLDQKNRWFIYRFFQKLLPQPHLPFILYSDFDTVKQARPDYWPEYLRRNLENYRYLKELFPQTIFVEANQIKEKAYSVFSTVENFLAQQNN
jgi:thymidylate kinase